MAAGDVNFELQHPVDPAEIFPRHVVDSLLRNPDGLVGRDGATFWIDLNPPMIVEGTITCTFPAVGG
jgi:hypothetical protein